MALPALAARVVLALVVLLLPVATHAQGPVSSKDAAAFMGSWVVDFTSPQGSLPLEVTVADKDGSVAVDIKGENLAPAGGAVKDVTKTGDALVMKYDGEIMGMVIPVTLTLTSTGGKFAGKIDLMDGQFSMDGEVKKK